MSHDVFISYRRDDASSEAGRLADSLRSYFGQDSVFFDTSDIRPGQTWPEALHRAVKGAVVVVAVFGPEWVLARDEYGRRRIDEVDDWVRREIQLALEYGKTIVPLLVRHARMPPSDALPSDIAALSEIQAFGLRAESWSRDVGFVLQEFERNSGRSGAPSRTQPPESEPPTVTTGDDFRAVALGFDSASMNVRNATAEEIKEIAASLELDELLVLCRSQKRAERVGAAIALGVHVRSSSEARQDRRVLSALGELLSNRSSLVRCRAAEVLRSSPALVPAFEDELRRSARRDENSQVRSMAKRALSAAGS